MQENWNDSELRLIVTGTRRDGRRRYDPQSKRRLAQACLQPGVSLAGMALRHGINANLLRKWVVRYQPDNDAAVVAVPIGDPADAFVPVILSSRTGSPIEKRPHTPTSVAMPVDAPAKTSPPRLRAQLPNGVTFEFECAAQDAALVCAVIDSLGRCDVPSRR
jgi:transposase